MYGTLASPERDNGRRRGIEARRRGNGMAWRGWMHPHSLPMASTGAHRLFDSQAVPLYSPPPDRRTIAPSRLRHSRRHRCDNLTVSLARAPQPLHRYSCRSGSPVPRASHRALEVGRPLGSFRLAIPHSIIAFAAETLSHLSQLLFGKNP